MFRLICALAIVLVFIIAILIQPGTHMVFQAVKLALGG